MYPGSATAEARKATLHKVACVLWHTQLGGRSVGGSATAQQDLSSTAGFQQMGDGDGEMTTLDHQHCFI